MGIIISLLLIAVGAILAFAVNATSSSIDIDAVGIILIVVGFILFLLSIMFWRTWWGVGLWMGGPGYVDEGPAYRRYWPGGRRRTTYVEDEAPGPGPPH